jgi:hypothetical protein
MDRDPDLTKGLSLSAFQATRRHTWLLSACQKGLLDMGLELKMRRILRAWVVLVIWSGPIREVSIIECFVDRTYRDDFV